MPCAALNGLGFNAELLKQSGHQQHPCIVIGSGPARITHATEYVYAGPDRARQWWFWVSSSRDDPVDLEPVAPISDVSATADHLARTLTCAPESRTCRPAIRGRDHDHDSRSTRCGLLPGKDPRSDGRCPSPDRRGAQAAVRVFSGVPAQESQVRRWVRALAPAFGLDADIAELVASELFANAILHTHSGRAAGKVTVAVTADGVLHIHDYGTIGPCPGLIAEPKAEGDPLEDFGRGLKLVTALSVGMAHLPAARCPAAGPDDPAAMASGCCTYCLLLTPAAPHPGGTQ